MARRFRVAAAFVLAAALSGQTAVCAKQATDEEARAILERMKSLSGSLEHMPNPPSLDKTMELPPQIELPNPRKAKKRIPAKPEEES